MRREKMDSPVTVHQVGPENFEDAFYLLNRFFMEEGFDTPADELLTSLQGMLGDPAHAVYIAEKDGNAVGVATATTSAGLEYGRSAELDDLYVLPEMRRGGVASALIEAVCSWCAEQGVGVVLVTVTPHGDRAHNLLDYYQRRGFRDKGRVILERRL
jgi:aminoglycoside 6'-N-acetyltransferase I